MRILIAGATGAIGRPLIRFLREQGHAVFALARLTTASRAVAALGAEPVTADALNAAAVKAAIARIRPDAVINELTSLPRHYTPAEMQAAAARDAEVRVRGNANLLAALGDAGVRRTSVPFILLQKGTERPCFVQSTVEPVCSTPKRKLENGEQRLAPQSQRSRIKMLEIADQRPWRASLSRGNVGGSHTTRK
jgi:hypothetical protein